MGGAALSASPSPPTLVKWSVHTILDEVQISSSVELCLFAHKYAPGDNALQEGQ
jgi:hypothetical protein